MKVLFAVNKESISEAIIKQYQKQYREIISYKNVYYFNAILKELQRDKSYDRIVISEDLEPFANNNYDSIDKFIFEKLDNISDEALDSGGQDTSIILICTDRRTKASNILVKLFGIGIYNALIGKDRSVEEVCALINRPRSKKEAKIYYKIEADDVNYQAEDSNEVNELELENILAHYKKLGKNTDRYTDSFNNIAAQYNDAQLKVIINCLPMSVKAVLEAESPKYQELMTFSKDGKSKRRTMDRQPKVKHKEAIKVDMINTPSAKPKMDKPVIIPGVINSSKVKKNVMFDDIDEEESFEPKKAKKIQNKHITQEFDDDFLDEEIDEDEVIDNSSKRMLYEDDERFNDITSEAAEDDEEYEVEEVKPKRGRGRPKKNVESLQEPKEKGKRGRPKKHVEEQEEDDELPGFDAFDDIDDDDDDDIVVNSKPSIKKAEPSFEEDEDEEDNELPGFDVYDDDDDDDDDIVANSRTSAKKMAPSYEEDDEEEDNELPGFDDFDDDDDDDDIIANSKPSPKKVAPAFEEDEDEEEDNELPGFDDFDDDDDDDDIIANSKPSPKKVVPAFEEDDEEEDNEFLGGSRKNSFETKKRNSMFDDDEPGNEIDSVKQRVDYSMSSLNSVLTKNKKIVTFVGTSKNGTSFLVNNLASLFSSVNVKTALLDMTKNKNSYYIYTKNDENLRKIAYNSIEKLQNGFAEGIKADKNLTVFTALPNDNKEYDNPEAILSTLAQNYDLVLIDCDFDTDPAYFANCQEIYLVQSMDILTIQPLTAFLRELKTKGVLEEEKLRIVINKSIRVKGLSSKLIIGGMALYNDPAMSFNVELFNRDTIRYCEITFEDDIYSKYLETLVNCNISINKYSKKFQNNLKNLSKMVYPTLSNTYIPNTPDYSQNSFSKNMNSTLSQMKKKY